MTGVQTCALPICFPVTIQQDKKITGTVVDSKGEPIIGASVLVKGTSNGTITDVDGNFSLNASQGSVLVVSYVGYTKKEISLGNAANYNITLAEDAQALSEVVVTAMGIKKEKKVTRLRSGRCYC